MKMRVLIVAVLTALATPVVWAASEGGDTWSAYGSPVDSPKVERVVHLGPDSHWVNVGYGETIRFVAHNGNATDRSFTWRFDVSPEVNYVDLSKVAPAGFPARNVRVFVSPNPLYAGPVVG